MLLTPAVSVIGNAGEDNVCTMLLRVIILDCANYGTSGRLLGRRSRWASRRRWQSFSLGDADKPVALLSCMVGRLRTVVELARGIEGLLKGESSQPDWLAAFLTLGEWLPFRSLIFNCR